MPKTILAVAVALGCLAVRIPGAQADAAAAPVVKVAVVDIDQVGDKFERKIQEENNLTEWYRQRQQVIDQLSALVFLSADEWQEVVTVYQTAKGQWTPAQVEREKALREQSTKREREAKDLDKPGRTTEEQGRFNLLQDTLRSREADLKKFAAQADEELRSKQQELGVALMAPVQAVIQQIATEKGYTLVLSKTAVFIGGDDITQLVIERVNAAAKAATGEKPAGGAAPPAPKPEGGTGEKPPAAPAGGKP